MTARFENKIALVTGAASGIGKAVMMRLASEGACVVALDIDGEKAARAASEVSDTAAVAMQCDVADENAINAMETDVIGRFGCINVLVNNAGIGNRHRVKLHKHTPEDWNRVMSVNVRGVFLLQRAIIPYMLAQGGGSIVNIAWIGSFRATALASPYITSKGAILMTTRAAIDYAKDNIRVNAVCPGTTNTEMLSGISADMMQMLVVRTPQGRLPSQKRSRP